MKPPRVNWRGWKWFTKDPIEDLEARMAREASRIAKAAFEAANWTYYPYERVPSLEELTEVVQGLLERSREKGDTISIGSGRFVVYIEREHGLPVRRRVFLDLGVMESLDDFFYEQ